MFNETKRYKESVHSFKAIDWSTTTIGTTSGTVTLLNKVPEGTSAVERIGGRVKMVSLSLRGFSVMKPESTVDQDLMFQYAEWMVVHDKAPKGALPVANDILQFLQPGSPVKYTAGDRFQILHREHNFYAPMINVGTVVSTGTDVSTGVLDVSGATYGTQGAGWTHKAYIKLKGDLVNSNAGTTGEIEYITEGALYLVHIAENVLDTADDVYLSILSRFTYTE